MPALAWLAIIFLAVDGLVLAAWLWRRQAPVAAGPAGNLAGPQDWERSGYTVTTRKDLLDVDAIHAYLARSYWAAGIDRATVQQAMQHSLCFGLFHHDRQIGYARVVTDTVRFAYLMDVYVLEPYQGQGLGQWLIQCVLDHPQLKGLRRVLLTTRDAQEFYRKLGFVDLEHPERWMQIFRPQAPP